MIVAFMMMMMMMIIREWSSPPPTSSTSLWRRSSTPTPATSQRRGATSQTSETRQTSEKCGSITRSSTGENRGEENYYFEKKLFGPIFLPIIISLWGRTLRYWGAFYSLPCWIKYKLSPLDPVRHQLHHSRLVPLSLSSLRHWAPWSQDLTLGDHLKCIFYCHDHQAERLGLHNSELFNSTGTAR